MIKKRKEEESNYHSVWVDGTTLRMPIDASKEVSELIYPEFYDVNLTDACDGECPYCYQDFSKGSHYTNIIDKFKNIFGRMDKNQRPFQIACNGDGHPDFIKILELSNEFGIVPNYTTNGMFVEKDNCNDILDATEKYSAGVAISCHPHLKKYWDKAYYLLKDLNNTKLNFHHIISDRESIDTLFSISDEYTDIDYHVLLPYMAVGRAKEIECDFDYLFNCLKTMEENGKDISKFAFGANFYPYICKNKDDIKRFDISYYTPEMFSKYIDLKSENGTVYPSSFNQDKRLCDATEIGTDNAW